jgi:hypothetical protein
MTAVTQGAGAMQATHAEATSDRRFCETSIAMETKKPGAGFRPGTDRQFQFRE